MTQSTVGWWLVEIELAIKGVERLAIPFHQQGAVGQGKDGLICIPKGFTCDPQVVIYFLNTGYIPKSPRKKKPKK
jgi:hypothetical protein